MTIPEYVEGLTRYANAYLIRVVRAMPQERRTWRPMDEGRAALDQVMECAQVADWFARILATQDAEFLSPGFLESERAARSSVQTIEGAEAALNASSERLFAALAAVPAEVLDQTVEIMPGWSDTLANVMFMPLRNLWYHIGQVNYIQTLYGDRQMH
jgi:hypothetical protein